MREPIVLLCKSYKGDLERAQVLVESVNEFNVDRIPFYMTVPRADLLLFQSYNFDNTNLMSDEDIVNVSYESSWSTQQVVKSEFWRMDLCDNYVMVDSDSYFIKNFKKNHFLYEGSIPYTVIHQQKDLWQYVSLKCASDPQFKKLHGNDHMGFKGTRVCTQLALGTSIHRQLDFGPGPVIWSSDVWESLYEDYLEPRGCSFADLININPSEFTWYGEWLLKKRPIDIIPIEPPFKFYHHREQYEDARAAGVTTEVLKDTFLGIVMQSNWRSPLRFD